MAIYTLLWVKVYSDNYLAKQYKFIYTAYRATCQVYSSTYASTECKLHVTCHLLIIIRIMHVTRCVSTLLVSTYHAMRVSSPHASKLHATVCAIRVVHI